MDAIVEIINQTRGMIAARSADGEFVILEILASAIPEKGDVVSHAELPLDGTRDLPQQNPGHRFGRIRPQHRGEHRRSQETVLSHAISAQRLKYAIYISKSGEV